MNPSEYIEQARKNYSLYVLQHRALPALSDGLKPGSRRVLWYARDGKKRKSAALAGVTMEVHPHGAPEGAVDTLAATYGNNIPLLKGSGAFGTRIEPSEYGASRYTSVELAQFTKDVVFRDLELIPMKPNYDNTTTEPVHFLPLIPISMLNPTTGVAVGFACKIFSRSLEDIINDQIKYLNGTKSRKQPPITFNPFNAVSTESTQLENGNYRWTFEGSIERVNTSTVRVTNLPYDTENAYNAFIKHLDKLLEAKKIVDYQNDTTKEINIAVKFRRSVLMDMDDEDVLNFLDLKKELNENINVIDFDGEAVLSLTFTQVIQKFCDWRLGFYIKRYERLRDLIDVDIEKYEDIINAIKNKAGQKATTCKTRDAFKEWLSSIGIRHLDYIASLPIYRFTIEEKEAVLEKIKTANATKKEYVQLIKSEPKRRAKYIEELKEVLKKYK